MGTSFSRGDAINALSSEHALLKVLVKVKIYSLKYSDFTGHVICVLPNTSSIFKATWTDYFVRGAAWLANYPSKQHDKE